MLKVHFLNVNQGDCTILEFHNPKDKKRYFGLMDSNTVPKRIPALIKLQALGAQELSFVSLTHPDADHYRGLATVMQHYRGKIGHFYSFPMGGIVQNRKRRQDLQRRLLELAEKQDSKSLTDRTLELAEIIAFAEDDFLPRDTWFDGIIGGSSDLYPPGFNGVDLKMIQPPPRVRNKYSDMLMEGTADLSNPPKNNEISLALLISYAGRRVMLGGDATEDNWAFHKRFYQTDGKNIKSEVVKLPHHGSGRDCTSAALSTFFEDRDAMAIISAGGRSHPHKSVLQWLKDNNIQPYCTNMSKHWDHNFVVEFKNTSGAAPEIARDGRQRAKETPSTYRPCRGDICITITDTGKIEVNSEFSPQCGCRAFPGNKGASLPSAPNISVAGSQSTPSRHGGEAA